ncbi:hypothetical protein EDC01DRAFT_613756 [Geopyxis carbonaria]|nr:hypothetical protein EDC01DRAFT_613756 [Geopyxis carbonaria]
MYPSNTSLSLSRVLTNPRICFLILFQTVFIIILLATYTFPSAALPSSLRSTATTTVYSAAAPVGERDPVDDVKNATLGFGEIMYISMPSRTDRQDAMNLLAATSSLQLTLIPGVDGTLIPEKAKPENYYGHVNKNEMGCWRAHANAWRRVLETGVASALILEDDVDWDTDVHGAFSALAGELRNNTLRAAGEAEAGAPYALDWDILMVGQCLHGTDQAPAAPRAQVYPDAAAPRRNQTSPYWRKQVDAYSGTWMPAAGGVRVLARAYEPVCTMGYAVTRAGAQRLLYHLGYTGLSGAVDLALARKLKSGVLSGYVVIPPLVNPWRVGGGKDSDIATGLKGKPIGSKGNEGGHSSNLRSSARRQFKEVWGRPKMEAKAKAGELL